MFGMIRTGGSAAQVPLGATNALNAGPIGAGENFARRGKRGVLKINLNCQIKS